MPALAPPSSWASLLNALTRASGLYLCLRMKPTSPRLYLRRVKAPDAIETFRSLDLDAAAVVAYHLPLKLNIVVAIAVAVMLCLTVEKIRPAPKVAA